MLLNHQRQIGGDCGLAICEYNFDINKLNFEWKMKDIDLLDLNIYEGKENRKDEHLKLALDFHKEKRLSDLII